MSRPVSITQEGRRKGLGQDRSLETLPPSFLANNDPQRGEGGFKKIYDMKRISNAPCFCVADTKREGRERGLKSNGKPHLILPFLLLIFHVFFSLSLSLSAVVALASPDRPHNGIGDLILNEWSVGFQQQQPARARAFTIIDR